MARYDLWQGDLAEPLGMQLEGVGTIAGADVFFVMKQVNGSTRIERPAIIDDTALRLVHYAWQPGDTDVPGVYRAVMKAVYPGQMPETFPSDESIFIVIHPKL